MESSFDKFVEELQKEIFDEARKEYSETAIDHWMRPRNWRILKDADGYGRVTGPCGDTMEISFKVRDNKIIEVGFITDGCASTIACGSITTELILGKSITEARSITQETILKALGGLPKADHHCALLSRDTLHEAIKNYEQKRREER